MNEVNWTAKIAALSWLSEWIVKIVGLVEMRLQIQLDIYSGFAVIFHRLQTMFRTFLKEKHSYRTESLSIGLIGLIKSWTEVSSHITDWKTQNQTFQNRILSIFPEYDFYGRETPVLTYRNRL